MATIKDVAKRAGVSISTVSYVLNNSKQLKEETRAKVMQAVDELGYRPNLIARSLKTRKTSTIGIIIPDIGNAFFTEIIRGIEDFCEKNNYSVILCNTYENSKKEEKYLNLLLNRDIDGLIFVGTGRNPQILANIKEIPIVVVDRSLGDDFSSVMVNNEEGGYIAASHLLSKDKRNLLFLSGPLSINTYFDRLSGYLKALKEHNIKRSELLIHETDVSYDGGQNIMSNIINQNIKFDSVFAANDLIALGAYNSMVSAGIKVPEEKLLIGFDDIATAHIITPGLTTIRQPTYEIGIKAAEILLPLIKGVGTSIEHIILEPELIIRETA